jgi:hypothetical protein
VLPLFILLLVVVTEFALYARDYHNFQGHVRELGQQVSNLRCLGLIRGQTIPDDYRASDFADPNLRLAFFDEVRICLNKISGATDCAATPAAPCCNQNSCGAGVDCALTPNEPCCQTLCCQNEVGVTCLKNIIHWWGRVLIETRPPRVTAVTGLQFDYRKNPFFTPATQAEPKLCEIAVGLDATYRGLFSWFLPTFGLKAKSVNSFTALPVSENLCS